MMIIGADNPVAIELNQIQDRSVVRCQVSGVRKNKINFISVSPFSVVA
jgi:hypothetical protein